VHWRQFEYLVGEFFRRNGGYNVTVTQPRMTAASTSGRYAGKRFLAPNSSSSRQRGFQTAAVSILRQ
jgi:hypothetical protein